MFKNEDFFYCYSPNLFKYLKMKKGINYICCGLNEKSFQKFWQFKRDEFLLRVLHEYKEQGVKLGIKNNNAV